MAAESAASVLDGILPVGFFCRVRSCATCSLSFLQSPTWPVRRGEEGGGRQLGEQEGELMRCLPPTRPTGACVEVDRRGA